jgi:hypothetical protein
MVDSILSFLTKHSAEILIGVLTTLIAGVVILWFTKIKHCGGLAWKKIKRVFLNSRPKVYRALGVAPIEDVQVLDAKVHRIGTLQLEQNRPTSSEKQPEMVFRNNVYWIGNSEEGPFCPKCYGGDRKEVRLTEYVDDRFWRCSVCDTAVEKPERASRPTRAETDLDEFNS